MTNEIDRRVGWGISTRDAQTKEPIPHVDVQLIPQRGTRMAGATNRDGYFFVDAVPGEGKMVFTDPRLKGTEVVVPCTFTEQTETLLVYL